MVVGLELMRERVVRETERRLAGDLLAEALGGRLDSDELRGRLRPFGIGAEAAVLVFELEDPHAGEQALELELANAGVPALVATSAAAGRPLLCAVIDGRAGDPVEVAGGLRSALAGTHGQVRAAASRAHGGRLAAPRLPRGPLRARGDLARRRRRPRGGQPSGPGSVHAAALAAGRGRAAPVQRRPPGADRAHRGRVRRRAPALPRGLHRAQRQLGAGGPAAVLPPPHAPLPDPQDRGAHRARPIAGHGQDRALAGASGAGSSSHERIRRHPRLRLRRRGALRVAVLGAGGTIAPAIVRDLAESDEVAGLLLLDLDEARAEHVASLYGGPKARAALVDARASADAPTSLARALRGLRRARQLGQLPGQPRRDGGLPGGGLSLPRPRRAVLDDRPPARARPAIRSRRAARPARHRLGAGQDEPDGAASGPRSSPRPVEAIGRVSGRPRPRPPVRLQRPLRAPDAA